MQNGVHNSARRNALQVERNNGRPRKGLKSQRRKRKKGMRPRRECARIMVGQPKKASRRAGTHSPGSSADQNGVWRGGVRCKASTRRRVRGCRLFRCHCRHRRQPLCNRRRDPASRKSVAGPLPAPGNERSAEFSGEWWEVWNAKHGSLRFHGSCCFAGKAIFLNILFNLLLLGFSLPLPSRVQLDKIR